MLATMLLIAATPTWAGAKVSAFQKDSKLGNNYWAGGAAIDGRPDTAWMVPGESPNRGEWIELDVPKGEIDKIVILPGFGKSDESFTDYPRVKKLRVDVFDMDDDQKYQQVGSATIDVADKKEMQVIDIPDIKVGATGLFGGKVKMSVVDIYEGQDFPNLAVSEIGVFLKEFDVTAVTVTAATTTVEGHAVELAGDANAKTFWQGKDGAELSVTSAGYGLSSVGFFAANKDMARPKTVEITVGSLTRRTELPDKLDGQWAPFPVNNGFNGGATTGEVTVKIIDSYPAKNPDLGLSEIKFRASCREDL